MQMLHAFCLQINCSGCKILVHAFNFPNLVHNFQVLKEKLDISFISGAHEVGIRIKIRSLNMCINESCCKINGCATSGGEDAK